MKKSKLKRRLRKQKRVGEFQEMGFEIHLKFNSNLNETESDKIFFEFIEMIEENHLSFGGGGSRLILQGFITACKIYCSPSLIQKENLKNWLENHSEIAEWEVGEFKDAWYDC